MTDETKATVDKAAAEHKAAHDFKPGVLDLERAVLFLKVQHMAAASGPALAALANEAGYELAKMNEEAQKNATARQEKLKAEADAKAAADAKAKADAEAKAKEDAEAAAKPTDVKPAADYDQTSSKGKPK